MSGEKEAIRFGVIGTGGIAEVAHLPAINKSKKAKLISVCDVDEERARRSAGKWGASEIYNSIDKIVASKNIDAILIAIPTKYHKDAVLAAAERKKHILCEKPIATNIEDAEAIIQACKDNNVVLQIGFSERFWNQTEIAKTLIDQGVIGKIYGYQATWNEKWDIFPAATNYRYDINLSGGASILDLAIHRIDLALYLIGDISRVCADVKHVAIPYKVDDSVWILCNFQNGGCGCISSNRYSPGVINPVEIYGTEGTLVLSLESFNPFHAVPLAVYTEKEPAALPETLEKYFYPKNYWDKFGKDWLPIIPLHENNFFKQLENFCDSVFESRLPRVTGEDGLKALEVVIAAYQSVEKNGWIDLPLKEKAFKIPKYV